MSRTKGLVDGYWYYRIYDVDTNELLAEGTQSECCRKLDQPDNHYHYVMWFQKTHPNSKPKWEKVEREWIPYRHLLKDLETGIEFFGDKKSCKRMMETILDMPLSDANFNNYWYGNLKRFERKVLNGSKE